jgi:hypothetical protein
MSKKKDQWTVVRVPLDVASRGRKIRDLLLERGQGGLPASLRNQVTIPIDSDRRVAARKFGVGQVLGLALGLLEAEIVSGRRR